MYLDDSLKGNRAPVYVAALSIALLTFLVYLPSLGNGFVNWDDDIYVTNNPQIWTLDLNFLGWVFTSLVNYNWYPLTILSLAVDHAIWGLEPMGYHLTNATLHTINTLLVFTLALRLAGLSGGPDVKGARSRDLIIAATTALLFGVHPLHVESVAWVTERKDVLYACFFLLSIIAYLRYARDHINGANGSRRALYYAASLLFFLLSLMSKPMAVTLPMVLLILDYYPLRRLGDLRRVLLEKLPFFALSLLLSVITVWAQNKGDALMALGDHPIWARLLVTAYGYVLYLYKMVLPLELAPYYPMEPVAGLLTAKYIGSAALVVAITWYLPRLARHHARLRPLCAAWFFYLVTLLPVSGIIQSGGQAAADRFTYIPLLGPFLLFGLGAGWLYEKTGGNKRRVATLAALVVLIFGALSYKSVTQILIWKDSLSLWTHEVELYPGVSSTVHTNLGIALAESGDLKGATENFRTALRLNPNNPSAHINLGSSLMSLGNWTEAIAELKTALRLDPGKPNAHFNLGVIYFQLKNVEGAIARFKATLRLDPWHFRAYNYLGMAYLEQGRPEPAIRAFGAALKIDPDFEDAFRNLGLAIIMKERIKMKEQIKMRKVPEGIDPLPASPSSQKTDSL